jgi:hypothetical protein
LTWKDHIAKVTKKIVRASGIIAKMRHFVNRNSLKLIYYALVYPYLIYGNLTWGNTYKSWIQKIMNIQKKNCAPINDFQVLFWAQWANFQRFKYPTYLQNQWLFDCLIYVSIPPP